MLLITKIQYNICSCTFHHQYINLAFYEMFFIIISLEMFDLSGCGLVIKFLIIYFCSIHWKTSDIYIIFSCGEVVVLICTVIHCTCNVQPPPAHPAIFLSIDIFHLKFTLKIPLTGRQNQKWWEIVNTNTTRDHDRILYDLVCYYCLILQICYV